jgi:hypothetical protein
MPINKVGKILFEILENGDNTIDLEEIEGGYNQYINIRLNNVVKTFVPETGEFIVKDNYHDLQRCTTNNF